MTLEIFSALLSAWHFGDQRGTWGSEPLDCEVNANSLSH